MTRSSSRLRRFARSTLRSGRRAGATRRLILLYHRIAAPQHDPFALAVRPVWFEDHLEILQSRFRMVALDEIFRTDETDSAFRASITFDDGYADNLTVASPMLREAGVPATFFVCTGSLGDVRGFWWDRVANAIASTDTPAAALEGIEDIQPMADLTSPNARARATLAMAAQLQPMHPEARDRLVSKVEERLPVRDGGQRESCPILDEVGLRNLGSQPLTQLGAHTHGHPMLSRLTLEEQRAEIARSIAAIHDITGTRPRFLAYPYGGEHDYNLDSCRAAEDAGMHAAFVNHGGRFDPEHEPYRVPRYSVPPLQADRFRTWLDGVLAP